MSPRVAWAICRLTTIWPLEKSTVGVFYDVCGVPKYIFGISYHHRIVPWTWFPRVRMPVTCASFRRPVSPRACLCQIKCRKALCVIRLILYSEWVTVNVIVQPFRNSVEISEDRCVCRCWLRFESGPAWNSFRGRFPLGGTNSLLWRHLQEKQVCHFSSV